MDSSLLCTLLILCFVHASFSPVADAKGFTLDVVHRRSKLSPFYKQSAAATTTTTTMSDNGLFQLGSETILIPGEYIIKLYLGYPPVEVYTAADTGSDYVWVQSASACPDCYQQGIRLFDPSQSSTFSLVSCYEPECQEQTQQKACGIQNECSYYYSYADQTFSTGFMSREIISISLGSSSENGQTSLAEYPILFGSAVQVKGQSIERYHIGITGLNRGPLSLISQLGFQKFSYCLQPLSSDSYGKIAFGDDVITDGSVTDAVSTPLIQFPAPFDNFYYANLEGATLVGSKTMIPNQGNSTYGTHILLDSGTTLTYLEPRFYKSLRAAVKSVINLKRVKPPSMDFDLCYNKFPEIEIMFHFTGADVKLKPVNLFIDLTGVGKFCFAMAPSSDAGANGGADAMNHIWGNTAQVNFQVTTDIANSLVSFAPADCSHV